MLHWAESTSMFMEGKAAMIYDANVFKALYENPKESKVAGKVGYAVIPAGPTGQAAAPRLQLEPLDQQDQHPRAAEGGVALRPVGDQQGELPGRADGRRALRKGLLLEIQEYKAGDKQPDWTAATMKSFDIGQGQWNPPVINVPEIRDITGQVIVAAIEGKDVAEAAKKAAELMDKKMEK